MALILDHINGVPNDNRLENLRIVCPNCAATLDTHCGRKNLLRERDLRALRDERSCRGTYGSATARSPVRRANGDRSEGPATRAGARSSGRHMSS